MKHVLAVLGSRPTANENTPTGVAVSGMGLAPCRENLVKDRQSMRHGVAEWGRDCCGPRSRDVINRVPLPGAVRWDRFIPVREEKKRGNVTEYRNRSAISL